MRDILKLSVVLLIICVVASALLAYTNELTAPVIATAREESAASARLLVMSEADDLNEKMSQEQVEEIAGKSGLSTEILNEIYIAKKDGEVIGYTYTCTVSGFGGAIDVLTGIYLDGTIGGVQVLNHNETPGLGAKATDEDWIVQYTDKNVNSELTVIKIGTAGDTEIEAITGATITSKAVTLAVNDARLAFLTMQGGN